MKIKQTNPPWVARKGMRFNSDPFYKSTTWNNIKKGFKLGVTKLSDGTLVPNSMCLECFKEGKIVAMHTVDHIVRIKDGGHKTDYDNLQSLCEHHHAVKSAQEGNRKFKK